MWRGHEPALVAYGLAVVAEWRSRGHGDTTAAQIAEFALPDPVPDPRDLAPALLPPWWGREDLHRSHRAALVRKDPQSYAWLEVQDPSEPYVWPEPPAPPPPRRPFTAWLVRCSPEARGAAVERGSVERPEALRGDRLTRKQRRQVAAFVGEVQPGAPIVVTDGEVLDIGRIGPGGPDGQRPVRFLAQLRRGDLERPWQLQDPRWLSSLRGEEAVRAALASATAE